MRIGPDRGCDMSGHYSRSREYRYFGDNECLVTLFAIKFEFVEPHL